MSEEIATAAAVPPTKKPASRPKARPKKRPKRSSVASSRPVSARKKKPAKRGKTSAKRPAHWSDKHAQLVLHATPELVAKLDRKLASLGKRLKVARPTRGSIVRALVMRAVA